MTYPDFPYPLTNPVVLSPFDDGVVLREFESGKIKAMFPHHEVRHRITFTVLQEWRQRAKDIYDFFVARGVDGSPFYLEVPRMNEVGLSAEGLDPFHGAEFLGYSDGTVGPVSFQRPYLVPDSEEIYLNEVAQKGSQLLSNNDLGSGLTGWTSTAPAGTSVAADSYHRRRTGGAAKVILSGSGSLTAEIEQAAAVDDNSVYRVGAYIWLPESEVPTVTVDCYDLEAGAVNTSQAASSSILGGWQFVETYMVTATGANNANNKFRVSVSKTTGRARCQIGPMTLRKLPYTIDRDAGTVTFVSAPTSDDTIEATYKRYHLVRFLDAEMSFSEFTTRVFQTGIQVEEVYS